MDARSCVPREHLSLLSVIPRRPAARRSRLAPLHHLLRCMLDDPEVDCSVVRVAVASGAGSRPVTCRPRQGGIRQDAWARCHRRRTRARCRAGRNSATNACTQRPHRAGPRRRIRKDTLRAAPSPVSLPKRPVLAPQTARRVIARRGLMMSPGSPCAPSTAWVQAIPHLLGAERVPENPREGVAEDACRASRSGAHDQRRFVREGMLVVGELRADRNASMSRRSRSGTSIWRSGRGRPGVHQANVLNARARDARRRGTVGPRLELVARTPPPLPRRAVASGQRRRRPRRRRTTIANVLSNPSGGSQSSSAVR